MLKAVIAAFWLLLALGASWPAHAAGKLELLNVSYDPTREFYEKYNALFQKHWKDKTAGDISIRQSHGGSAKQARAVIDGLQADVVTLALAYDIDVIAQNRNLLPQNWQELLPNNSSPYTSTIVFLVKKGNPKGIKDWGDLIKEGVEVITPNPKTSGGARWNYLAAYGYADKKFKGDEAKIMDYMKQLFKHVPVLDTGARGSTTTFVQRGIGDVLLTWENEAYLAVNELGKDKYDIVVPPVGILAEPPVAVIQKNAEKKKTQDAAREYLTYLYSKEAQELAAEHYYRPQDKAVLAKYKNRFPTVPMMTIADFGGWKAAQKKHFDDGGLFDELSKK
ncbi:MAG: sulfate ABC transporter substrate-binding protein [Alphaproteobacteria bacterium]|nr:sulfate ABC transporter substrate-binding protein [Alphaproteobacteria bacterium]